MRIAVLAFMALSLLPPHAAGAAAAKRVNCTFDRAAMLALDQHAFDQGGGGWRSVASQPGCEPAAADLIRDYRLAKGLKQSILFWHEGQMRALGGDSQAAVGLFEQARQGSNAYGWNTYVDASIAFLRRDRSRLLSARAELAALPAPEGFSKMAAEIAAKGEQAPTWPPNLDVVDGLIACFDKPYAAAMEKPCRPS